MSSINTGNTPAFTRENIVDTLKEWAGMRVQFFLDRIETLWESLSKEQPEKLLREHTNSSK